MYMSTEFFLVNNLYHACQFDKDCNFFCHQVLNLKKQLQQKEQALIEKEKKVLTVQSFYGNSTYIDACT